MKIGEEAWNVHEEDFPRRGSLADKLTFCVRYAILAPSTHNTQPWFFGLRDEAVDVYADRLRALPVVDPDDRELIISCGAALELLVIAMGHFGIRHEVELVQSAEAPDHVARVRVREVGEAAPDPLFGAIARRHTSRVAFSEEPISPRIVAALEADGSGGGVSFQTVPDLEERVAVADLVEQGDRLQMADPRFRRELAAWVHRNRTASRDGMPGYAFGLSGVASALGPVVIRRFDLGESQAAKDRALALKSPLLGVVLTDRDDARAWAAAGRALSRVLLRATALGLSASFLNQPVEVAELRPALASTIGRPGNPQALLRLGFAPPARPTPRRALADVIVR